MFKQTVARAPRVAITLRGSRTDTFGVGCTLYIGRTDSRICPVTALLAYLAIRPLSPGPLFVHANGSTLTRSSLVSAVCVALSEGGVDLPLHRSQFQDQCSYLCRSSWSTRFLNSNTRLLEVSGLPAVHQDTDKYTLVHFPHTCSCMCDAGRSH